MSTQFDLSPQHLHMLRTGSGISDAVIAARGYRTVKTKADLRRLGFTEAQQSVPGLLIPVHAPDGSQPLYVYRPDYPRTHFDRRNKPDGTPPWEGHRPKVIKYEFPRGAAMRVDCPPTCQAWVRNPAVPLWITEGQKKADALASNGLCSLALLGVWNFKGRNEFGASTVLADLDYVAWKDRDVRIVFDSDVMTKPAVQGALARLIAILRNKGSHVKTVYLPPGEGGGKQGVDDYLAAGHAVVDLEQLAEGPKPALQPPGERVTLLRVEPESMRQPIVLVGGRGYVAIWPLAEVEKTEKAMRDGTIVKLEQPEKHYRRLLFVVADDGKLYSETGALADGKIGDLGFEVKLPEMPDTRRTWGLASVEAFCQGQRPIPGEVFRKVKENVSRFIDFDQSLASQETMSELISCYIIATYFLPAFNTIGFLWANGDRGSGKSQLLKIVCYMAYLGEVLLMGGSYPTLRDLADYGACLGFDDAENVSDPQKMDADKRALMLAGNNKGAMVPVKELDGNKVWRTRRVSTYCPRVFSAIRQPDAVLASRCIVVPLVRTPDRTRANADVNDAFLWPHERGPLTDELWALALANLAEMAGHEFAMNDAAELKGRALEPWRAVLAVAHWLDDESGPRGRAVPGLFERMQQLSVAYQGERERLEPADLKSILLRVLRQQFEDEPADAPVLRVGASILAELTKHLVEQEELEISADRITANRIARILSQMGLKRERAGGNRRMWLVPRRVLTRALEAYGLAGPFEGPAAPSEADGPADPAAHNRCTIREMQGTGQDGHDKSGLIDECGRDGVEGEEYDELLSQWRATQTAASHYEAEG